MTNAERRWVHDKSRSPEVHAAIIYFDLRRLFTFTITYILINMYITNTQYTYNIFCWKKYNTIQIQIYCKKVGNYDTSCTILYTKHLSMLYSS